MWYINADVDPSANTIQNEEFKSEARADLEGSSEELDDKNLQRTADSKDLSPRRRHRDLSDATSTTSLLGELLVRFFLYMKSQDRLTLILVITSISILLLMQVHTRKLVEQFQFAIN